MLLLMSGYAAASETAWTPSSAQVAEVESHLMLPQGNQPIASYARFYYGRVEHGHRELVGVFVLEAAPAGVHIVTQAQAPRVLDGGCSVINLTYDPTQKKVTSLFCNGDA